MKKLLKRVTLFTLTGAMTIFTASCSLLSSFIGEAGYFGVYGSADAGEVITTINGKKPNNETFGAFTATYVYEYANKAPDYDYRTKYNLTANVDMSAAQNEVFATLDLIVDYKQADGRYSIDADVDVCIVRTGEGQNCSDYSVYARVNEGTTYQATLYGMMDRLDELNEYYYPVNNEPMKYAFATDNTNSSPYLELIIAWIEAEYGEHIVSTGDNPFIQATHDYNIGLFVDLVSAAEYSTTKEYKVSTSGKNKFRASRSYSIKKTNYQEKSNITAFLKLNDDGTYNSKYSYSWSRKNPYDDRESTYERTLEPRSEKISRPAFAN